jgi:hypothetical protein
MGLPRSLLRAGAIALAACGSSPQPVAPPPAPPVAPDPDLSHEVSTVPDHAFVEKLAAAWSQLEPRIEAGIERASAARDRGARDSQRTLLWDLERERQSLEDRARAALFRARKAGQGEPDAIARQSLVEVSDALGTVGRRISDAKPALMQTLAELGPTSP